MDRSRVRGPYARFCERDEVSLNYLLTSPYSIWLDSCWTEFYSVSQMPRDRPKVSLLVVAIGTKKPPIIISLWVALDFVLMEYIRQLATVPQ